METHEYSNGEVIIIWKPSLCIHAGNCVKHLPKVYRPKERPWIHPEQASRPEFEQQIPTCPSGALSMRLVDETAAKNQNPITN